MIARVATLVLILVCLQCVSGFDSRNVVFTIVSQSEPYHASVAERLRRDIEEQVLELEERMPTIHTTHLDLPVPGAWTIVPLLGPLVSRHRGTQVKWLVFLESHTAVRCKKLLDMLATADKQADTMWLGYPLSDEEPTIIHHFTFYDMEEEGFTYPYFACGFAMRMEFVERLLQYVENGGRIEADFSIDPAFELAQLARGVGVKLASPPELCVTASDHCATYPKQFPTCGSAIPEDSIYFAVKTWSGFHSTRARVVKKTWGRYVTNLHFYSDVADPTLPSIDTGVPNSKTGHCMKTIAILNHAIRAVEKMPHVKWIFLADDDTILGVHRLCEMLSCYRGGDDVTILGERYGYGYNSKETAAKGYDYPTGGGGAALARGAARRLAACGCARAAPDDMTLGACARARNLSLTHSPLFHQARPHDYPRDVVSTHRPVSFHRHSSPEPARVYATWFLRDDSSMRRHTEL